MNAYSIADRPTMHCRDGILLVIGGAFFGVIARIGTSTLVSLSGQTFT